MSTQTIAPYTDEDFAILERRTWWPLNAQAMIFAERKEYDSQRNLHALAFQYTFRESALAKIYFAHDQNRDRADDLVNPAVY